jgi:polyisoprenoid-binding protein YceI
MKHLGLAALFLVGLSFAGDYTPPGSIDASSIDSNASRALCAVNTTLTVDPVHSFIIFKVKHLGAGHVYGRFTDLSGTVEVDDATGDLVAATFDVKAMTLDTAVVKRDEHLKGPEFLNVKAFPEIVYKTTKVHAAGKDTYELTGNLTLHGVTKPLVARATRIGVGKAPDGTVITGYEATFTVMRSEFDVKTMPGAISEEVYMTVAVEVSKR